MINKHIITYISLGRHNFSTFTPISTTNLTSADANEGPFFKKTPREVLCLVKEGYKTKPNLTYKLRPNLSTARKGVNCKHDNIIGLSIHTNFKNTWLLPYY